VVELADDVVVANGARVVVVSGPVLVGLSVVVVSAVSPPQEPTVRASAAINAESWLCLI
jgi:hypothetical protein